MRRFVFASLALALILAMSSPASAGGLFGGRLGGGRRAQACQVQAPTMPVYQAPAYPVQAVPCPTASVVPVATVPTGYAMPAAQQAAGAVTAASGDAAGFVGMLNAARAMRGLAPVAYDPGLASGAAANTAAQARSGMGHWIMSGVGQCAAMAADPATALNQWIGSPAHAAILFNPAARVCGFSCGNGFATANIGG